MTRLEIIYPNFRRVQSGVSTTVFRLARVLRTRPGLAVHVVGYQGPEKGPATPLRQLLFRPGQPAIWHARRNVEMLAGIMLRRLGANLRLVFTSAAQRYHTRYTRWLMRQMDRIVYTSARSASFVPIAGPIVGHGVDLPASTDRRAARQGLGLDPDALYLGSFGAIRPSKGTDLFVDVLLRLLPERPNWRALVVGPSDVVDIRYRSELMARVRDSGLGDRISFTGYVKDATQYLRAVDLCVAPSRAEGFGLTAIEAMAAGIPVVASRAGSYPETILDGVTGRLAETGSLDALAHAMAELMDDGERRRSFGLAARRHVEQHWSLDAEAGALIGIYCELAGLPACRDATGDLAEA